MPATSKGTPSYLSLLKKVGDWGQFLWGLLYWLLFRYLFDLWVKKRDLQYVPRIANLSKGWVLVTWQLYSNLLKNQNPKMRFCEFSDLTLFFQFWHFPPIFVLLKVTYLITLFDRKLQVFQNSPKWTIFDIFNELLSSQNVIVAYILNAIWIIWMTIFKHYCELSLAKSHVRL